MMEKKPTDKKVAPGKARLKHIKPGKPGFLRPRVPGDADFEAFLTRQGFYPLFSDDTKRRLLRHLQNLDFPQAAHEEIDALERQAALTQYRYVHRAKRRLSEAEQETLAGEVLDEAERFRTALDKLVFHGLIADPHNVDAPLPNGSGIHVLRYSLRDLQAAIDDFELQLAAVLGPNPPDKHWQPDQSKPGNAENIARSSFIDACVRIWLRNGGPNVLTYRVQNPPGVGGGQRAEFETGLWPFVLDATRDTFTGEYLSPLTPDGLAKHLQRHMDRIRRTYAEDAWLAGDSGMKEWGTKRRDERTAAAIRSDVLAVTSLRNVLSGLKKR